MGGDARDDSDRRDRRLPAASTARPQRLTGSPARIQACVPPATLLTFLKPIWASARAARALR